MKCLKVRMYFYVFFLFLNFRMYGEEAQISITPLTIKEINFVGLKNIQEDVLESMIESKKNIIFNESIFLEDIQRLKNTTVFTEVVGTKKINSEDNTISLTFNVNEKWTIIPYLIAGSGGGSSYVALGVFDTNFLGRLYLAQFQFKVENKEPNFFGQFRNDHLLGLPLTLGFLGNYSNKLQKVFHEKDDVSYFSYSSTVINPYLLWKFNDYFKVGGGVKFEKTEKINDQLSSDQKNKNAGMNFVKPNPYEDFILQFKMTFGRINYEDLALEGMRYNLTINTTPGTYNHSSGSDEYTEFLNDFKAFLILPPNSDSYLALRLFYSFITSQNILRHQSIGGLTSVRGFNDDQFLGQQVYYSNIEYRMALWKGELFAFQFVPFVDSGKSISKKSSIFHGYTALSFGAGIRIPFIKVNTLAFRADYARTISPFKMSGLSFSMTQFY